MRVYVTLLTFAALAEMKNNGAFNNFSEVKAL
jgi:hypothetical protein